MEKKYIYYIYSDVNFRNAQPVLKALLARLKIPKIVCEETGLKIIVMFSRI